MRTAIIYSSKYGTTEKVANMIAEKIRTNNDVTLISLSSTSKPDLSSYEKVILGTSIYAGRPGIKMWKFCQKHRDILQSKTIGLFICGMQSAKKDAELRGAYPEYLHSIVKAEDFMGGELLFEKMSFFRHRIMKRMTKADTSVSKLDNTAIDAFSKIML